MKRRFRFIFIPIIGLIILTTSSFAQGLQKLSIDSLAGKLKSNNAKLQSARFGTKAAHYMIQQRSAWEAPMVGIAFDDAPIKQFPEQKMISASVSQRIPFPGKKGLESHAAHIGKSMMESESDNIEQDMLVMLYSAYYDLYLHEIKIRLIRENQIVLHQLSEVAQRQYETGMGKQADILKIQTEYSIMRKEEISLMSEVVMFQTEINNLTNQPASTEFETTTFPKPTLESLSLTEMMETAKQHHPRLQMMNYQVMMLDSETERSKKDWYPDFEIKGALKQDLEMDIKTWMVEVGVTVPIAPWSSGSVEGKTGELEMKKHQAEYELIFMTNEIENQIRSLYSDLKRSETINNLYLTTIVPQADLTLQSTIAAYKTGKATFMEVNDAHHMLIDAKINQLHAENDFLKTYVKLQRTMGILQ